MLISKNTGLSTTYIYHIMRSASHRYKLYTIPKRTGGQRLIAHPAVELKLIQRWLVANVFSKMPVHEAVYSYRKGRGIHDLASIHKNNKYFLRVDFSDFFSSIKNKDVAILISKRLEYIPFTLSKSDYNLIQSAVCRNSHLTIGAPSSPAISNAILYDFDKLCYDKAKTSSVVYSRYADDLYFSTNRTGVLTTIYKEVELDINRLSSPNLFINEKKTVFSSKKHRRMITGLIITPDSKISIGRKKKRYIKSLIYRFINGNLDIEQKSYLKGYLSYIKAVDPEFLSNLNKKYGNEVVLTIKELDTMSKKKY